MAGLCLPAATRLAPTSGRGAALISRARALQRKRRELEHELELEQELQRQQELMVEQELAQIRAQERKAVDTWLTAQAHRQETRRREKQVRPAMVRFQARCRGVLVRLEMRAELEMERASREAAVVPLQKAWRKYRRRCIVGPYHTVDAIAAAVTSDDAAAPLARDAVSAVLSPGITRRRGHERKMHDA